MGWLDSLQGSVVGFDTMPLMYYIEENPNYLNVIDPFFEATAISVGASYFLTNDTHLPTLPNLKTLVLDDLKRGFEG